MDNKCTTIITTQPGIPAVNQTQFCSKSCVDCVTESVNLKLTGSRGLGSPTCDTSIIGKGNGEDFNKISPVFTNTSIPGCFEKGLQEVTAATVTWTGAGSWTPNKLCVDWNPDTLLVSICTFNNQMALGNGESATATSCEYDPDGAKKCNFDSTTCP